MRILWGFGALFNNTNTIDPQFTGIDGQVPPICQKSSDCRRDLDETCVLSVTNGFFNEGFRFQFNCLPFKIEESKSEDAIIDGCSRDSECGQNSECSYIDTSRRRECQCKTFFVSNGTDCEPGPGLYNKYLSLNTFYQPLSFFVLSSDAGCDIKRDCHINATCSYDHSAQG